MTTLKNSFLLLSVLLSVIAYIFHLGFAPSNVAELTAQFNIDMLKVSMISLAGAFFIKFG